MANLKEIRRRIGSVKNTQKITKAMKLVSAAKFAKAALAAKGAMPYGEKLDELAGVIALQLGGSISIPLATRREEKKVLAIVITSDRGLCGALNTNVIKKFLSFLKEKKAQGVEVEVAALGKKINSFLKIKKGLAKVSYYKEKAIEKPSYAYASELFALVSSQFVDGTYDAVYMIFPKFVSALSQQPTVTQLLPLSLPSVPGSTDNNTKQSSSPLLVEPSPQIVLEHLLTKQFTNKVFRAFLDSLASEYGARMTAMDSATNNASDVIYKLTLEYNRGRQAAITKELIEITSGAQAL